MNIIEKTLIIIGMYIGTIIILFMGTIITLVCIDSWTQQLMGYAVQLNMEPMNYVFYAMIMMFVTMCFISYRERA